MVEQGNAPQIDCKDSIAVSSPEVSSAVSSWLVQATEVLKLSVTGDCRSHLNSVLKNLSLRNA